MMVVYAIKSGRWSDPSIWNTGELPKRNFIVSANGNEVVIDMDVRLGKGRLTTRAYPPGQSGGRFIILPGIKVRCAAIECETPDKPIVSIIFNNCELETDHGSSLCSKKR